MASEKKKDQMTSKMFKHKIYENHCIDLNLLLQFMSFLCFIKSVVQHDREFLHDAYEATYTCLQKKVNVENK